MFSLNINIIDFFSFHGIEILWKIKRNKRETVGERERERVFNSMWNIKLPPDTKKEDAKQKKTKKKGRKQLDYIMVGRKMMTYR